MALAIGKTAVYYDARGLHSGEHHMKAILGKDMGFMRKCPHQHQDQSGGLIEI
jgi:hypothetical protein